MNIPLSYSIKDFFFYGGQDKGKLGNNFPYQNTK